MVTLNVVQDVLVPFIAGVVIPFLTNWITARGWPASLETVINIMLSSVAAVATTITFNGDWKEYLLALAVAWTGAMRGHYTGLPQLLYSNQVTGRHAKPEE